LVEEYAECEYEDVTLREEEACCLQPSIKRDDKKD
jgi:hypothetical protein